MNVTVKMMANGDDNIIVKSYTIDSTLSLNKLEPLHAAELFNLTDKNRDYLRQTLPWLDNCQKEQDSLDFIMKSDQDAKDMTTFVYGIFYWETLIGVISLHDIDLLNKKANIGYWIDEEHQGRGLITLACQTIIDAGFNKIKLQHMIISCNVDNLKSQTVATKLNFKKTCTIDNKENLYGKFVHHFIYQLDCKSYHRSKN